MYLHVFIGAQRDVVARILSEHYLLQGTSASSCRLVGHVVVSCYKTLNHRRVNLWPSARERGAGVLDGMAKFIVFTKI